MRDGHIIGKNKFQMSGREHALRIMLILELFCPKYYGIVIELHGG